MPYKTDLEKHIRESYQLILEYDKDLRFAVDAIGRARAQRAINELWTLIEGYLSDYISLCKQLQLNIASDLKEIVARFPEYNNLLHKNAVEIFYSYTHEDERLRKELEIQLSLLKRQGIIASWNDRDIKAGQDWKKEIDIHLNTADIILLLVSPGFMASDYCYDREMMRAIERHDAGEAHVIPIILRPCDWHSAPFGKLKALPTDGKPVTSWSSRDEAFLEIAKGIRKLVT